MSLRLIQQSQDKKILLTHVYCKHREEEEEKEHKIKVDLLLKKTIVTYYFEEQKMILQTRWLLYL